MPSEFDSMIAKIIAHGRTREEAISRLRRAIAETMVVIEDGATNQGFLLELLGRPELQAGEVDTGWLDRLHRQGAVQSVQHADVALVRAAIELCDAASVGDRELTPPELIDCIITEEGCFLPEDVAALVDRTPFLREGYALLRRA